MSLRDYEEYKKITEKITKAILNNNVSHAYIIEGDSVIDKMKFTKDFIKGVLCKESPGYGCDECSVCRRIDHDNYEDLYVVEADGNSVKVKQVTQFCAGLNNKPTGGERNIGIIKDADAMMPQAQNKLLKTLEEPNPGTIIFLLSENTEHLLQTINSRCITYRLGNFTENLVNEKMEYAEEIMSMIREGKYFAQIKDSLTKNIKERKDALELLDGLERLFRTYLLDSSSMTYSNEKIIDNVKYIEEARKQIMGNVNHKYAIRNLILKIGG